MWRGERECFHAYEVRASGGDWRRTSLRPDGLALLSGGVGGSASFIFNEIDRGHVGSVKFEAKAAGYAEYATLGLFARRYEAQEFTVATVTTGLGRLDRLRALVRDRDEVRFLFTTFDRLDRGGSLGQVWVGADGRDADLFDV